MSKLDLIIRNGTIVDGSGAEPFTGDVGIKDGMIVEVGAIERPAEREFDALGHHVTPGFVDIHTHYDGQVTWENRMMPSSLHGVTTIVMGNCGVGFAPCRPNDRSALIALMEGVEDIPEAVMSSGLPWSWETFPEYLDAVDARQYDVDVAAFLPHSCLRVYVMGQRGLDREDANENDLAEMERLAEEAMRAGAMGFATSRSVFHRDCHGNPVPTKDTQEPELMAVAAGMKEAGHGILEALLDYDDIDSEFGMLRRVVESSRRPLTFTIAQLLDNPRLWERAVELVHEANDEGINVKGQVIGRPTGLLLGLDLSFNPFTLTPAYQAIASLPLQERVAEMRKPDVRARILADKPTGAKLKLLDYLHAFDKIFPLGNPPNYAPAPETSIAAMAKSRGMPALDLAYDLLLEQDGHALLFVTVGNYADGNLDAVTRLVTDRHNIWGLGDGGAHYGVICDAGSPTFMLTFWGRDKEGQRVELPELINRLSRVPAEFVGLNDRGLIAPGHKADINVIDFEGLHLHAPHPVFDLPSGGRRLIQKADGYLATFVNGEITYRNGIATDALPGRLVRGPQHATVDREIEMTT